MTESFTYEPASPAEECLFEIEWASNHWVEEECLKSIFLAERIHWYRVAGDELRKRHEREMFRRWS